MNKHDEQASPLDPDQAPVSPALQAALTQARWHLLALLAALTLFAAAESWLLLTDMALARVFALLAGLIAGLALAQLVHEWGHYLGARLSGATVPMKPEPALLAYDFDFQANSPRQFLWMSVGGSLGNIVAILLVCWLIPLDYPHRVAMLAATVGAAVFVAVLEWPIINHARRHQDPMGALVHQFGDGLAPVFRRSISAGVLAAVLLYWWLC